MLIKFSIIIPAFNAEAYIGKCIASVVQQDINPKEYEVIIINDGSTDQTGTMIEEWKKRYPNTIQCFHTVNQGVSEARNLGMDMAKGEFILFIDADDYLSDNVLSTLYQHCSTAHLDILLFDYQYWNEKGELLEGFDVFGRKRCPQGITQGKEYIKDGFLPATVWMMTYRREFMQSYHFRFANIRHEDEEFIPRVFYYAQKVEHIPLVCYHYLQSQTSFMQNYKEKNLFDKVKAMDSLNQFNLHNVKEKDIQEALRIHIALRLYETIQTSYIIHSNCQKMLIKSMQNAGLVPMIHSRRKWLYLWLYRHTPNLFIQIYKRKYCRIQ